MDYQNHDAAIIKRVLEHRLLDDGPVLQALAALERLVTTYLPEGAGARALHTVVDEPRTCVCGERGSMGQVIEHVTSKTQAGDNHWEPPERRAGGGMHAIDLGGSGV